MRFGVTDGEPDAWIVALEVGDARLSLLFEPDPAGARRAMVHANGYAVSHLELQVPAPFVVSDLCAAIVAATTLGDTLHGLRRVGAGTRARVQRRILGGQALPFWPVSIRRGTPSSGRLWPFDAELAGLRLGLRRLVRREGLDDEEAAREREYFEARGLFVRFLGPPHGTLVASLDESVVDEASAREAANVSAHGWWQHAARWVGDALGYPRCCIDRFVRIRRRDEKLLFSERLPPIVHEPLPPHTQWLDGALALISHAPCEPACAATAALARALLKELDRESAGFASTWLALARRVHLVDRGGTCLALDVEGPLNGGRVRDALELAPPADVRARPDLHGLELRMDEFRLVADSGLVATLVADHRGA